MKTLRNLEIAGGLLLGGTGVPAAVGDQVTLSLDTDANPAFPESIVGVIQHPISNVKCGAYVAYNIEYDEADLEGAVEFLHEDDVVDTVLITQGDVLAAELVLKAPSASPTFTGTVTLGDAVNVVVNATTGTQFGTAVGQKLAFHGSVPVIQRASAAQAAVVTTPSALTSYGYTQAQADSIVTLLNEIRAALVEKGIIKGSV